jgi:hypothetical protein
VCVFLRSIDPGLVGKVRLGWAYPSRESNPTLYLARNQEHGGKVSRLGRSMKRALVGKNGWVPRCVMGSDRFIHKVNLYLVEGKV